MSLFTTRGIRWSQFAHSGAKRRVIKAQRRTSVSTIALVVQFCKNRHGRGDRFYALRLLQRAGSWMGGALWLSMKNRLWHGPQIAHAIYFELTGDLLSGQDISKHSGHHWRWGFPREPVVCPRIWDYFLPRANQKKGAGIICQGVRVKNTSFTGI